MVLGRNVEQDQMTCRIQDWQLCLSYFWRCLPLLYMYLTVIIHWFRVCSVSQPSDIKSRPIAPAYGLTNWSRISLQFLTVVKVRFSTTFRSVFSIDANACPNHDWTLAIVIMFCHIQVMKSLFGHFAIAIMFCHIQVMKSLFGPSPHQMTFINEV